MVIRRVCSRVLHFRGRSGILVRDGGSNGGGDGARGTSSWAQKKSGAGPATVAARVTSATPAEPQPHTTST